VTAADVPAAPGDDCPPADCGSTVGGWDGGGAAPNGRRPPAPNFELLGRPRVPPLAAGSACVAVVADAPACRNALNAPPDEAERFATACGVTRLFPPVAPPPAVGGDEDAPDEGGGTPKPALDDAHALKAAAAFGSWAGAGNCGACVGGAELGGDAGRSDSTP
jgi:hypothetical protein